MNGASQSLKELTVVASDKIRAFKQHLDIWETFIHHLEPGNFAIFKGFFDEISGDVNKYDLKYCVVITQISIFPKINA